MPAPQPERRARRAVPGAQVGTGREDRDPGVSEAQDVTRPPRERMRTRRARGSVALHLVGAVRRQQRAVCDSLDESRLAAMERLQNLRWRPDAQRASRQLERRIDAPVDRPAARRVDEAAPIDERAPALKIQSDVIEPEQASKALREEQQLEPIVPIDQRTKRDRVAI